MIKPMELKLEMPLEGVVSFYQELERFLKLCEQCRASSDQQKLLCGFWASQALDNAYSKYLANFSLIIPILRDVKPLCLDAELDTASLREMLTQQLAALERDSISQHLELIEKLRRSCPSSDCSPSQDDLAKLSQLGSQLKLRIQQLYLEDFLRYIRRHLENAVRDPEMLKSMFPLPPKPLKEEYRI